MNRTKFISGEDVDPPEPEAIVIDVDMGGIELPTSNTPEVQARVNAMENLARENVTRGSDETDEEFAIRARANQNEMYRALNLSYSDEEGNEDPPRPERWLTQNGVIRPGSMEEAISYHADEANIQLPPEGFATIAEAQQYMNGVQAQREAYNISRVEAAGVLDTPDVGREVLEDPNDENTPVRRLAEFRNRRGQMLEAIQRLWDDAVLHSIQEETDEDTRRMRIQSLLNGLSSEDRVWIMSRPIMARRISEAVAAPNPTPSDPDPMYRGWTRGDIETMTARGDVQTMRGENGED